MLQTAVVDRFHSLLVLCTGVLHRSIAPFLHSYIIVARVGVRLLVSYTSSPTTCGGSFIAESDDGCGGIFSARNLPARIVRIARIDQCSCTGETAGKEIFVSAYGRRWGSCTRISNRR
jgi:hypothetical protein